MITTTIAIAENKPLYQEGICCLLRDNHCSVTLATATLQHLLVQLKSVTSYPDVCLFNIILLEKDGANITGQIKKHAPATKLIGYYIEDADRPTASKFRLDAVLSLGSQPEQFVQIIRAVGGNAIPIPHSGIC